MALKLSFIIEAIDRATAPIRAVNRMIESTTGPIARVSASWNNLSSQARGIAGSIALIGGATAGAFYPLHRMIEEGSGIHDMVANLGMTTREFQRLAYVLTLDSGSAADAGNAMKFLERNAVSAALGSQEMAMWTRRSGMSMEFLRAHLNDPQKMLEALADAMHKLPSGALRTELAMIMLGRGGDKTVQTLSRGSKALKEMGDEAESLGVVLDETTIKKMKESDDGMQKAWRALRALTAVIATAALPVIQKITLAVIEWSKANRGLLQERATQFFAQLSEGLPKIIKGAVQIAAVLGAVVGVLNTLAGVMGGWGNLIILFAGVKALMFVVAIGQMTFALWGMLAAITAGSLALLASPVGVIAVLIAGFAAWAKIIYDNWEPIAKFFTDLWEGVKNAFGAAVNWISEKIAMLTRLVTGIIGKLNDLQPAWMKHGTLPGIALNAVAGAIAPGGAGKTNLGGTLKIEIDQKGRASVTELTSENSDALDFEVYLGQMMLGAGS